MTSLFAVLLWFIEFHRRFTPNFWLITKRDKRIEEFETKSQKISCKVSE